MRKFSKSRGRFLVFNLKKWKKIIIGLLMAISICIMPISLQSESEEEMPYIPEVKVGNVVYDLKDKRVEGLITDSQRASIHIDETYDNIAQGRNIDLLFDRSVKPGQKLHIITSTADGNQVNLYKILKQNDPSVREVFSTYVRNYDEFILSTEEEPIWGIRVYVQQASSEDKSFRIILQAESFDDSIDDYEETKKALYSDIKGEFAHTIESSSLHYFHYFPYKLFPGQTLYYEYSISGGSFYLYKLFDYQDSNNREVIQSAKNVSSTKGIIIGNKNENFVGFMVWVNEKVLGSRLDAKFHAEGFHIEDSIIPRTEIEPVLANLAWNKDAYNNPLTYKPFVSVHFSDMHGDSDALKRIVNFSKKYKDYIDDVIHTGDAVLTSYEDPYDSDWYNNVKILQIIGNHDAWTNGTSGCKAWTTGYSAKQCYERFIEPIASNITSVPNKCYWSKKYVDSKIMLIAIDNWHWSETIQDSSGNPLTEYPDGEIPDTGEQLLWFTSMLADAKENEYAVIVLSHAPAEAQTHNCSFTSLCHAPIGGISPSAIAAVQDYIDGGGEFITWLCGHTHWDYIGEITNYPDQPIIVIDSARAKERRNQDNWQENHRIEGTRSENLFNIFSVDHNKKYITLFRVGMEYDKFGRHVGSLVYDYENKEVIWNN